MCAHFLWLFWTLLHEPVSAELVTHTRDIEENISPENLLFTNLENSVFGTEIAQ